MNSMSASLRASAWATTSGATLIAEGVGFLGAGRSYTHILVGAGSAGCVLAEGLSSDPRNDVLLLEAGPDYLPHQLPSALRDGTTPAIGSHDWGLSSTGTGRTVAVPRGRVVGGTSQINSCIALRPEVDDFSDAQFVGSAWRWPRMAECFAEVEDDGDHPGTGSAGPVRIRRDSTGMAFPSRALIASALAIGHPYVKNHNAPGTTGAGPAPLNLTADGTRLSANATFLQQARHRSNLSPIAGVVVEQVLSGGAGVEGVRCQTTDSDGSKVIAEFLAPVVVLCAGAYGTPVILQRSGFGPRRHLESLGVAVVADLPGVGANLSEHVQVPFPFLYDGLANAHHAPRPPCVQSLVRYTSDVAGVNIRNDMQLCAINHVELAGYNPSLFAEWSVPVAASLTVNLMSPRGRGEVRATADRDGPGALVKFAFMADARDRARLRGGARMALAILSENHFDARITHLHRPSEDALGDEEALDRWIAANLQPGHHPVGTARIGRDDDPGTVVDEDLAVRGTTGLYVADASVLPEPVRANTNLTVMALARNALRLLPTARSRSERKS